MFNQLIIHVSLNEQMTDLFPMISLNIMTMLADVLSGTRSLSCYGCSTLSWKSFLMLAGISTNIMVQE